MTRRDWIRIWNHRNRTVLRSLHDTDVVVAPEKCLPDLPLSILFFSDLHWRGNESWHDDFRFLCDMEAPDILLFGGDLTADYHYGPALDFIAELPARKARILIPGNWDHFRMRHIPFIGNEFLSLCNERGICCAVNQWIDLPGLSLYAADDSKEGAPDWLPRETPPEKNVVVVTHNPDAVISGKWSGLGATPNLFLCGHTHGGQIRLPGIGALRTSSSAGRRFDYGGYRNTKNNAVMIISSGVGNTLINTRINCPRELLMIGNHAS